MSLKRKLDEKTPPAYEVVRSLSKSKSGLKLTLRRSLSDRKEVKPTQSVEKFAPNPKQPTIHILPGKVSTPPSSCSSLLSSSSSPLQTEPPLPAVCKVAPVQRSSSFQVTRPSSSAILDSTDDEVSGNASVILSQKLSDKDEVKFGSQYQVRRDYQKQSEFSHKANLSLESVNEASCKSAGGKVREIVRETVRERADSSQVYTSNKTQSADHQLFQYHMYRSIEKPVFESDVSVLQKSDKYQALLQTYITLLGQRTRALRDLDQLENLRVAALRDPVKFIGKLQSGNLVFPCRQKVR